MTGYQVFRYDSTNNYVDAYEKIPPVSQGWCLSVDVIHITEALTSSQPAVG